MTTINRTELLLDLAAGWRTDWDRDELSQALVAAKLARWTPERTLLAVARLLCDPKAVPHDLAVAARSPLERGYGEAHAEVREAALADMRAAAEQAGAAVRGFLADGGTE